MAVFCGLKKNKKKLGGIFGNNEKCCIGSRTQTYTALLTKDWRFHLKPLVNLNRY